LRIRVSKSAIGSVIPILNSSLLPTGLDQSGDISLTRVIAQT
jgi:hypothetical protein